MSKKNELERYMNENSQLMRINKELIRYINEKIYKNEPYKLVRVEEELRLCPFYEYDYIIKLKEESK